MINEITENRLIVSSDSIAGPYLMVSLAQLDNIIALLDRHSIWYWVDSDSVSLNGGPAITVVNFGRNGKAAQIQEILDRVETEPTRDSQ